MSDIVSAIQALPYTFQKHISIENSTHATTKAIDTLSVVVQKIVSDVNGHSEKMRRIARDFFFFFGIARDTNFWKTQLGKLNLYEPWI